MKPRHRSGRKFVFFSLNPNSRVLRRHLSAGGTGYFFKDGWIIEARGEHARHVMRASDIPVTMLGAAHFHVQNAMCAIAACRAYGMSKEKIARPQTGHKMRCLRVGWRITMKSNAETSSELQ